MMSTGKFDFESGELCLDFANTVDWHASLQPHDRLTDIYDLVAWGEAAGTLSSQEAERLQQLAEGESEKAGSAFERAVILREAIYRIFSNRAAGEDINSDDLDILNEALREAMSHLQLTIIPQGFKWEWVEVENTFDRFAWAVARSAGELMTSDRLVRVSECADDRGCGYLFIDTSRNSSRRWCSMGTCGNRAKASRSYRRKREAMEQVD
jgi:predicted RNA-binding Zn ribbon-like protein